MSTNPVVPQDDAEARRPDVLPTAPTPIDVVRPVAPVVSGSHVLATASGGLDFDKQSVYFDLSVAGQDEITAALLGELLDAPVTATVTPKHDVTGLKLRIEFAEPAAFNATAGMIEDARRKRAGVPTVAEEAAKQAAQDAAVVAEEAAAKAKADAEAAEEDRIAQKAAAIVLAQLAATNKPEPPAAT